MKTREEIILKWVKGPNILDVGCTDHIVRDESPNCQAFYGNTDSSRDHWSCCSNVLFSHHNFPAGACGFPICQ